MTQSPHHYPLRVGLFGIGLDTYWPQFAGLEDRLKGYVAQVAHRLSRPGVEIVNIGLIDSPEKALDAGHALRRADVDIIFLYVTTYALSSTVLPVVQRAGVPVIILNLQPSDAIDYASFNALGNRTAMTGEWLAYCAACPVPEIANVLSRAGIAFHQVTGVLEGDAHVWHEVEGWLEAARVRHVMAHNRLGLMGRYYNGMLDIYSDPTLQAITFGTHLQMVELDELTEIRSEVTEAEAAERVAHFRQQFDIQPDCDPAELTRAARTSVALDRFMPNDHQLGSLAYYAESVPGHANEDVMTSIILGCSLLTARGRSGGGRVRDQERAGDEDHGRLRGGRLVHRVLRARLCRRRRADGPRRPRPHPHRPGKNEGAPA